MSGALSGAAAIALLERICALATGALRCEGSYVLGRAAGGAVEVLASYPRGGPHTAGDAGSLEADFAAACAALAPPGGLWAGAPDDGSERGTLRMALSIAGERVAVLVAVGVRSSDAETRRTASELVAVASAALATATAPLAARREVDDVLAMLGHEIRGHLNEIVLVQGLLLAEGRMGTLTADQQTRIRQFGRAATRVAALLDGLTELGRRTDAMPGAEPVDVRALAADVVTELRAELAGAPHLSIAVAPDLPPLRGDAAVVRTVLRLLLQMLRKHSVSAHGDVVVRVRAASTGIALEVSGDGVPKHAKPHAGVRLALYTIARTVEPVGGTVTRGDDGSLCVTVPDHP